MKNSFQIKYSKAFYKDFDDILFYIQYGLNNKRAAKKMVDKVEKAINKRLKQPCGYEKYKTKAGNIYYRIYINNYIVFYTLKEEVMEVRRIIYSRRNINNLI